MSSLFSKIMAGEVKGQVVYQDDQCAALLDINPQAPKHILLVPRKELRSVSDAATSDQALLGHLLLTAAKIAIDQGFADAGYRLVINTGADGGQTVDHLHIHILAGRAMHWPPG